MVHPSQQIPPFVQPRAASRIVVSRNGRSRGFNVGPLAALLVLGCVGCVVTAFIAATGYLVYRDDLLGGAVSRQVRMQYEYEDRIAALRAELDRITSRHAVRTEGVAEQLAVLLERQAIIEGRQATLDGLLGRARGVNIDLADLARLPRARPEAGGAPVADPATALSYVSGAAAGDVIAETLIRKPQGRDPSASLGALQPVLTGVKSSLADAEAGQADVLEALEAAADAEAEDLAKALAPIGVTPDGTIAGEPRGGPYVPAAGLHFSERTALLQRKLDDLAAVRRSAESMPVGLPVKATRSSSRFGYRMDPFLQRPAFHAGVDFAAREGAAVRAAAPGEVVFAGRNGGYGNMVEIRHADGMSTRYGHLSAVLVSPGAAVERGMQIGRVGSTGRSTGPHLHYETRRDGKAVNPGAFLAAARALGG